MITQNQGVIRLLPNQKKKQELRNIENWRPNTLLIVDYKKKRFKSARFAIRKGTFQHNPFRSSRFCEREIYRRMYRTIDDVIYFTDYKQ